MFLKAFGAREDAIKKNCIILPSNDTSLFPERGERSSGMFFSLYDTPSFTLINLRSRWLAGDAALLLKETGCENIIVFGSCGGLTVSPGAKILAERSINLESFTSFLEEKQPEYTYPDRQLRDKFTEYASGKGVSGGDCATVSSLVLEYEKKKLLTDAGVDCVDMECSMVFSAARASGKSAIAVFYAADSPGSVNFYDVYEKDVSEKIKGARKSLAGLLSRFIKSELT